MDHSTNEKMPIYKIARPILGTIYKLWYNPKVIGKENIPKEGSILLVGNHIHIMDQCNVIISTKRNIHYMAKKEYFDPQYKEGKFPWFFRGAGCIPVDRTIKDDEAVESAMEVLKQNHALGLFPEGTRNGLKEERAKELYEKYGNENISFEDFYNMCKESYTLPVIENGKIIKKNKNYYLNYSLPDSCGELYLCKVNPINTHFIKDMAEWAIHTVINENDMQKSIKEVESWKIDSI